MFTPPLQALRVPAAPPVVCNEPAKLELHRFGLYDPYTGAEVLAQLPDLQPCAEDAKRWTLARDIWALVHPTHTLGGSSIDTPIVFAALVSDQDEDAAQIGIECIVGVDPHHKMLLLQRFVELWPHECITIKPGSATEEERTMREWLGFVDDERDPDGKTCEYATSQERRDLWERKAREAASSRSAPVAR